MSWRSDVVRIAGRRPAIRTTSLRQLISEKFEEKPALRVI